jgi:hypothetical protein
MADEEQIFAQASADSVTEVLADGVLVLFQLGTLFDCAKAVCPIAIAAHNAKTANALFL